VDEADEDRLYTEQVRQRRELGQIHRALGIATWVSMTATVVLGFIQFYNLYGFGAGQDTNPCAAGSAVFGQEQCYGNPWPPGLVRTLPGSAFGAANHSTLQTVGACHVGPASTELVRVDAGLNAHAVQQIVYTRSSVARLPAAPGA
jgi:hypothetical protein